MPLGEDGYYAGGAKKKVMHMLYSVMSKTVLGKLMVSDHCENGIREMKYLDELFEEYRNEHPGGQMPTWDEMRKWALPAFENADDYTPQNTNDAKTKSRDYFNNHRRSKLAGGGYWRHDYKYAFSIIKKIKPENLIDIGCGPGAFLSEVSRLFPEVLLNALDLSEEMIEETKSRLSGNVTATVGDSENMPLEDEQYQVVTCNMSIHHYPHPQKAVDEMYRILKKGGYLLLNDMDCAAPIRAVANFCFPRLKAGDVKMYNRDEIVELVKTAGFKKIKYRKISPFTFQP